MSKLGTYHLKQLHDITGRGLSPLYQVLGGDFIQEVNVKRELKCLLVGR